MYESDERARLTCIRWFHRKCGWLCRREWTLYTARSLSTSHGLERTWPKTADYSCSGYIHLYSKLNREGLKKVIINFCCIRVYKQDSKSRPSFYLSEHSRNLCLTGSWKHILRSVHLISFPMKSSVVFGVIRLILIETLLITTTNSPVQGYEYRVSFTKLWINVWTALCAAAAHFFQFQKEI